MTRIFLLILCWQISTITFAQVKEICITLDDLPVVSYDFEDIEFQRDVVKKLVATFDSYNIPAIGFVNEKKLYTKGQLNDEKVGLLRLWLESGYELGNHTYAHKDYHKVSFEEFTEDVLKGEEVCSELVKAYDQSYRYFRHPFLHVGLSKAKHDSLTVFLQRNDYAEAPVSIDNDDYLFAYAYSKAMLADDTAEMIRIGTDYVDYMEEKLHYFEKQSEKLLGRNIRHILLLHANAINADYLDELAERYRENGYSFISMREALEDESYQREISAYNSWGISWIDRWALSEGKKGEYFKDDPVTPDYVKAYLNGR